jgi:hypothetical protein
MTETIIVTNCTNRKRANGSELVRFRGQAGGDLPGVAKSWLSQIDHSPADKPARLRYCGRSFSEALNAERASGCRLLIVSAGLGLIDADTPIPNYSATISPGPDSVLHKIPQSTPSQWWNAVIALSPFSMQPSHNLGSVFWVALSNGYFKMIESMLLDWADQADLRIFGKIENAHPKLRPYVLPYDDRLNDPTGPNPGTEGDFPQRALAHFAMHRSVNGKLDDDIDFVRAAMSVLQAPSRPMRKTASDREIVDVITKSADLVGWRSTAMLRHLRDELGMACEQGRFKELFKVARREAIT